jgi:hypothetical protein
MIVSPVSFSASCIDIVPSDAVGGSSQSSCTPKAAADTTKRATFEMCSLIEGTESWCCETTRGSEKRLWYDLAVSDQTSSYLQRRTSEVASREEKEGVLRLRVKRRCNNSLVPLPIVPILSEEVLSPKSIKILLGWLSENRFGKQIHSQK